MAIDAIRRVMLHGSQEEWFGSAVRFALRLTDQFGAELHVVYTIEEPLSAGWTDEMPTSRLPELHRAMEEEARNRLAVAVPPERQGNTVVAIRTGLAADELIRYTTDNAIDLAIVQASDERARGFVDRAASSVLLLR